MFHSCNLYSCAILKDQQKKARVGPETRKGQARTVRCRSVLMCSSDSCKYVVWQDEQSEANIGPKKRKDRDANDSSEDSEMQVSIPVQQ